MAEPRPELALRFQRRFLAARPLSSLPWPELEQSLRTAPDSALLADILHKIKTETRVPEHRCGEWHSQRSRAWMFGIQECLNCPWGWRSQIRQQTKTERRGEQKKETILHPLCVKYPPSAKYRRCFLTELIKKLESTAAEPLDELYEALADVLKEEEECTHCYKSYLLPSGDSVSLCESTALICGGTTGLLTWEAALLLAQWALQNPGLFRGRTVLELGSGIGFTGIAICKTCQPRTFIFSDCHPRVLRHLGENIQLNGFTPEPDVTWSIQTEPQGQEVQGQSCQNPKVIVAELDWGSVTEKQLLALRADVVIAADVVYDPEIILALVGMLQKLSTSRAGRKAPEVFIASTIRNPDTFQLFQAELDKAGIRWQVIPAHSSCHFLYDVQPDVTILQLFL